MNLQNSSFSRQKNSIKDIKFNEPNWMAQTYASEYMQINDAEIDAITFIFQSQHHMKYARHFLDHSQN